MEEENKVDLPGEEPLSEEDIDEATDDSTDAIVCERCSSPYVEEGYRVNLCENCRTELSGTRIPIWITGFSLVIIALLAYSLIKFPSTLKTGIAFEKGIKYEQQNKYLSALHEYEMAAEKYPDSTLVLSKLFVMQFNNQRVDDAAATYEKLVGREVEDNEVFEQVSYAFDRLERWYYPTNEFAEVRNNNGNLNVEQYAEKVKEYVEKYPEDEYALTELAYVYYDLGNVKEAESIMSELIVKNPDYIDGIFFQAAIYRETGQYDKAIDSYNQILEYNQECADAVSAIARIELKKHNDAQALETALRAYDIDAHSTYVLATLALAYHFNNMADKRDEVFKLFKKEKYSQQDLELLTGIFNGSINDWR